MSRKKSCLGINSFNEYFSLYGGIKEIYSSIYFHYSVFFALILTVFGNTKEWFSITLSLLPNVLGFSIGAYAILLALGNSDFWKKLTKKNKSGKTHFMVINASFVHFIVIQIFAILFALFFKVLTFDFFLINFIGLLLLIYAILLALASTLAIFKLAKWYQDYLIKTDDT